MSLDVNLTAITGLKGKADRFCRFFFRGVPATSNVLQNCHGDALFNEEFFWPLETPLDNEEWLELRLYNRNKIFQDRLIGAYRLSLSQIIEGGSTDVVDNLIDTSHTILRIEVRMSVTYRKPEPGKNLYDHDLRSEEKSIKSVVSVSSAKSKEMNESQEIYHPKIHHPKVINNVISEWIVQLRIIQAKDLAGVSLDPVVMITCGLQKKQTSIKKQTNNPDWDELFVFDFKCSDQEIFDSILLLEVFTGKNIISDGSLIGLFKCDLWYVHNQPDHSFFSKFAPLLDGATTEIKGYVRVDLQIFTKGDVVKDPPPRKDDLEINQNLILPPKVNPFRPVYQYQLKIYAADGLPQMNANLLANVKKAFSNKLSDMADPFVEVSFAGLTAKTPVIKNTYQPEFNTLITFTEFFPPLCRRIKIQLKDSDMTTTELIGTHFIDMNDISDKAERRKGGFMPTFGPSWVNLYGSTRDYSVSEEHNDLNNGLGEGISYRGRVLLWMDCFEGEPGDTGIVEVEECEPLQPKLLGKEEIFQLFATFYEASMLPKKLGDSPVQFEIVIGEYGFLMKDLVEKKKKDQSEDDDKLYSESKAFVQSVTAPVKPLAPEKIYYYVPFGSDKPCTHIKFPFEDQRRRHYNFSILKKIYSILEDNLEELDERVRLEVPKTNIALKNVMGDLVHHCSMYIDLADGKRTGTHLGKNKLDQERTSMTILEIKNISLQAADIALCCISSENIKAQVERAHALMRLLRKVVREPQHGLPDVFVWMIRSGKRVAYTRIPAEDILYSKVDAEKGRSCGRVQTIFLRLPGKMGHGENGWAIQAKIEVRFWLGLMKHKTDYLKDAPPGFEQEDDCLSVLATPPSYLRYTKKQKFVVRAHLYQARSLIGSDDSGLSDVFCRCIVTYKFKQTYVVWETRSPTWDMMLKFDDIELWGEIEEFAVNPPIIVLELFDQDFGGGEEFIGRILAKPVVKLCEEKYEKPFFPPVLQWFPVYRGETRAGEVLAAFEMLHISDNPDIISEIPEDPPLTDTPNGLIMRVPDKIRPVMKKHRIEVLFWGVRDLKKAQFMSVNSPQVELDCCYKIIKTNGEEDDVLKSVIIKSAARNPNFHDCVDIFDVWLPEAEKYLPPLTIHVNDCRAFGRQVLCGTHVINSLHKFFMDPSMYTRRQVQENDDKKVEAEISTEVTTEVTTETTTQDIVQKKKKEEEVAIEIYDWWTRFYETQRDMEEEEAVPSKKKKDVIKEEKKVSNIPRLKIYLDELENVEGFSGFNDFLACFNLLRGKKTEDEDDELKRFSGKFKGNFRLWKYPLPPDFDTEDEMGTFYRLPSNEPINLLVRVYVIRAINLHPMDSNGKADPYLVCSLGKKKYNDKDKYVSKQLSPEFGRCFEFKAVIPFDTVVRIDVMDWDMLGSNDLIGSTEIDIEDRFFSKHRPSCGIQLNYINHGYAAWRDPQKPAAILSKLCKEYGIDGPYFNDGAVFLDGKIWHASPFILDEKGKEKISDEPVALEALHHFEELAPKGFKLVPEHVETRSLFNPEKKGIEMGKVQMWIDMFPMELTMPGPPVDVSVRKPTEYVLRVTIWNTSDVLPSDTNIISGETSSDQYVKGWLEGNREDIQQTDVHYKSMDGSAMFNWRFIFSFMFHKAEEKIVTFKKANIFSIDLTEEKHKPYLYLQVWDADLFSADDFIGDVVLSLTRLPSPAKTAKGCKLDILNKNHPCASLLKMKNCRGWWPFQVNPEDDDDPDPILAGKVEAELNLYTKEEAEAMPAGKGREEPLPLEKPNRPNDSFFTLMGPLTMLRYMIWEPYKFVILKLLVVAILVALLALFFYSMPGYLVKKIFGA
ncbi:otoferlin isoform X2 [Hydra vulgaris]|uniref:otoferlin isoform X2 n=1 Tax=Hydra vulgaris TaxID=6087 RepID=UPI001F5F4B88|nr:otoferlin isoform X2 [Hydra vulgaris]